MNLGDEFLQSARKRLKYYKDLGDKTFAQLNDAEMHFQPNGESNSIAVNIRHMAGNMLSRWTDFLTTDGEKEWRERDTEFDATAWPKQQLLEYWEKGWKCFTGALESLGPDDLLKTVHIRGEGLLVVDAINRQMAHYPYHVGQIIYTAKIIRDTHWNNLSIPRGNSGTFNQQMRNKG